ncbi:MAG TPA: radical SAM protein [Blastocatellia bacterium]|nr:radical SAM protein [Blastocatellia bacterium]
MMKTLTLIVTDACNLKCTYCFQQRSPKRMSRETAERAIDLHFQHTDETLGISFFGGEPLLELDLMKHAVRYAREKARRRHKRLRFSMTTNGMLVDRPTFSWLNQQRFSIKLSFDGVRPEHELARGRGTSAKLIEVLDIARSMYNCRVRTHTVVTPETVDYLAESIQFLYSKGILEFEFGTEFGVSWSKDALNRLEHQYRKLVEFAKRYYDKWELMPFEHFTTPNIKGGFKCDVGCSRGSYVGPDGEVYGCTFHVPMWRKHGEYPEDFNLSWGSVDKLYQIGLKGSEFKSILARVNASPYQAGITERHTDSMKCSECPINRSCDACFVSGFQFNRGPLYVPQHICHMTAMRIRFGEELAAYTEHRAVRKLPELERMQEILNCGNPASSKLVTLSNLTKKESGNRPARESVTV